MVELTLSKTISTEKLERWLASHMGVKTVSLPYGADVQQALILFFEKNGFASTATQKHIIDVANASGYCALRLYGSGDEFYKFCGLLDELAA